MITIEFTEKESEDARAWQREHVQVCPYMLEHAHEPFKGIPALGEHWYYKAIPGGLGPHCIVGCVFCGAEKNVTDTSCW